MNKLWDYEHPYYMSEGCFFHAGCSESFASYKDFIENWSSETDIDMNRIHRWDFQRTDEAETGVEKIETLNLFYVMQRKAYTFSVHIKISEEDHDAIREFLKPYAELNQKLWAGIL